MGSTGSTGGSRSCHNIKSACLFVKLAGDDDLDDRILIPRLIAASEELGISLIGAYSYDVELLSEVKNDFIDSSKRNVLVFEDMNEKSTKYLKRIEGYFTKARKVNC